MEPIFKTDDLGLATLLKDQLMYGRWHLKTETMLNDAHTYMVVADGSKFTGASMGALSNYVQGIADIWNRREATMGRNVPMSGTPATGSTDVLPSKPKVSNAKQLDILINLDNEGHPRGVLVREEPEYFTWHLATHDELIYVSNLIDATLG